ncbi:MAG: DUF2971 domain-containing protein [Clostridia bacterium]|nr:DUF2971 domain-containing protein [Clostridia bacterium]
METNAKNDIPKLIFKYKPLSSGLDIVRCYDIIQSNRLFVPDVAQLNDPFEGFFCPRMEGVAGSGILRAADEDPSILKELKKHTRVLALSSDCFSPQLWAYYCNDYSGVSFCFYTNRSFKGIEKVEYPGELNRTNNSAECCNQSQIKEAFYKSLLMKEQGWQYEHEWRIIKKQPDDEYMSFEKDELAAIIIGHKLDKEIKEFICASASHLSIFTTYPGVYTGKVHLIKYTESLNIEKNGKKPDFIDSVEDLYNTCGHINVSFGG